MADSSNMTSQKLRIAWIGNSQCFYNDLPAMVQQMLKKMGVDSEYEDNLVGGRGLRDAHKDVTVTDMLAKGPYDYVVLQDDTNLPGGSKPELVEETIEALNTKYLPLIPEPAKILLYTTAAQQEGTTHTDERDVAAYPDFLTMQTKTIEGYERYLSAVGDRAVRIPYGDFMLRLYKDCEREHGSAYAEGSKFPDFYLSDKMHPTRTATYAIACLFVRAIVGTSPIDLDFEPQGCAFDKKLKMGYYAGKSSTWPHKFKSEYKRYIEHTAKNEMDLLF